MNEYYTSLRIKLSKELARAFEEDHSPREIGASFAFGIFLTIMPTLGLGLLVFLLMIRLSARVSSLALMSSVIVVNPFVKPVFYLASVNIGGIITGKNVVGNTDPFSLLIMLYTGSFVIAIASGVISYFFVVKAVDKYRKRELEVLEDLEEVLAPHMSPSG